MYCANDSTHTYTSSIDALGHLWGEQDTIAATSTEPKKVIRICLRDSNHIDVIAELDSDLDQTTAVEIVKQTTDDGKFYVFDIMGRLVRFEADKEHWYEGLKDGIYMVNGHKYIIQNLKVVGGD